MKTLVVMLQLDPQIHHHLVPPATAQPTQPPLVLATDYTSNICNAETSIKVKDFINA
jgi:hypothetical protein